MPLAAWYSEPVKTHPPTRTFPDDPGRSSAPARRPSKAQPARDARDRPALRIAPPSPESRYPTNRARRSRKRRRVLEDVPLRPVVLLGPPVRRDDNHGYNLPVCQQVVQQYIRRHESPPFRLADREILPCRRATEQLARRIRQARAAGSFGSAPRTRRLRRPHTQNTAANWCGVFIVYFAPFSANTAYAVAASLMNRPTSDDRSRCLFNE